MPELIREPGRTTEQRLPAQRSLGASESGPTPAQRVQGGAPGRRWQTRASVAAVSLDAAAATLAAAFATVVAISSTITAAEIAAAAALPAAWVLSLAMQRSYRHGSVGQVGGEFSRVLRSGATLLALVAAGSHGAGAEFGSGFVLVAVCSIVPLTLLGRGILRVQLRRLRARGRCLQRTLLVGPVTAAYNPVARLQFESSHGVEVVGVLDGFDAIEVHVAHTRADAVAVLPGAQIHGDDLRRLAWRIEKTGAELVVFTGLTEIAGHRLTMQSVDLASVVAVAPARLSGPARAVKGVFDRVAAALGLVVLAPLLIPVAVAIWAGDRGNPFFRQSRVGRNGEEFRIWKFRTMVANAEAQMATLVPTEGDALLFKLDRDPRITPIGHWLRRYSVDELPQLVNVVRGEMSLVGPRPQVEAEVRCYGDDIRRRLLVKPGLTGLWQVSGRSDLSVAEWERLDLRYVENWSLGLDLAILWRTVRAVVRAEGAR
ncbi:MAG: sugar transferase [Sporichthyaceae bacterium]